MLESNDPENARHRVCPVSDSVTAQVPPRPIAIMAEKTVYQGLQLALHQRLICFLILSRRQFLGKHVLV